METVVTEMEERPNSSKKANSSDRFLRFYKEHPTALVILIGILYGIGWFSRSIAILSLGVGPLTISRESAVAAGACFALLFGPVFCLEYFWLKDMEFKALKRNASALVVTLFLSLTWMFLATSLIFLQAGTNRLSYVWRVWLSGSMTLTVFSILFLVYVSLVGRRGKNLVLFQAIVVAGSIVYMFGWRILPTVPANFGGFIRGPISLRLKEPSATLSCTLLDSDDTFLIVSDDVGTDVLSHVFRRDGKTPSQVLRLSWDRVQAVRRLPPPPQ